MAIGPNKTININEISYRNQGHGNGRPFVNPPGQSRFRQLVRFDNIPPTVQKSVGGGCCGKAALHINVPTRMLLEAIVDPRPANIKREEIAQTRAAELAKDPATIGLVGAAGATVLATNQRGFGTGTPLESPAGSGDTTEGLLDHIVFSVAGDGNADEAETPAANNVVSKADQKVLDAEAGLAAAEREVEDHLPGQEAAGEKSLDAKETDVELAKQRVTDTRRAADAVLPSTASKPLSFSALATSFGGFLDNIMFSESSKPDSAAPEEAEPISEVDQKKADAELAAAELEAAKQELDDYKPNQDADGAQTAEDKERAVWQAESKLRSAERDLATAEAQAETAARYTAKDYSSWTPQQLSELEERIRHDAKPTPSREWD